MKEYVALFKINYNYVFQVFESRKERFEHSFTTPVGEGEPTAEEVFIHAVTAMYKHSIRLLDPTKPLGSISLSLDESLPLSEKLLEGYRIAIDTFEKAISTISEDQLDKIAESAPPHARHLTLREWIGYITMHTIGHVAQALRLQAIILRHY